MKKKNKILLGLCLLASLSTNTFANDGTTTDTSTTTSPIRQGNTDTVTGDDVWKYLNLGRKLKTDGSYEQIGANSLVLGGTDNIAVNKNNIVLGGTNNQSVGSDNSMVIGGTNGIASGSYSLVIGGQQIGAHATNAIAIGGVSTKAMGTNSISIGGEHNDTVNSSGITIGGESASNSGVSAIIIGGTKWTANGDHAVAIGGSGENGLAAGSYASLIGGAANQIGTGSYGTNIGGTGNILWGDYGSIIGGKENGINGNDANTVIGGYNNKIEPGGTNQIAYSTISGGSKNRIVVSNAAITGGESNFTGSEYTSIVGGQSHIIGFNAKYASIVGGNKNTVEANYGLSIGGYQNYINEGADYSITLGSQNTAGENATNSIVLGNRSYSNISSGIAIGNEAVATETGTISFGHKAGDVANYSTSLSDTEKASLSTDLKSIYTADNTNYQGLKDKLVEYGIIENYTADTIKSAIEEKGIDSWVSDVTAMKESHTSFASDQYNRLVNIADGTSAHDAATVGQMVDYQAGNGIDIAENGTNDLGQTIKTISVNATGKVALDDTGVVSGDTVWKALNSGRKLKEDGSYEQIGEGSIALGGTDNIAYVKNSISIAGTLNRIFGENAIIIGGKNNQANNELGVIIGGSNNNSDRDSIIIGTENGQAGSIGKHATLIGGYASAARDEYSTVVGGSNNTNNTNLSTIVGGFGNDITITGSSETKENGTIVGGYGNQIWINGNNATIIGGKSTTISGDNGTAIGGNENRIIPGTNYGTFIGGRDSTIVGDYGISIGGRTSYVVAKNAISIGKGNIQNDADNSVVIGTGYINREAKNAVSIGGALVEKNATNSVIVGRLSSSTVENGVAIGTNAVVNETGTVSFGHSAGDTGINYVELTDTQKETLKTELNTIHDANNTNYSGLQSKLSSYNSFEVPSENEIKESIEKIGYDKWLENALSTTTKLVTTYDSDGYNRLVKIADGTSAHDAATVGQTYELKAGTNVSITDNGTNDIGQSIKTISVTATGNVALNDTNIVSGDTVWKAINSGRKVSDTGEYTDVGNDSVALGGYGNVASANRASVFGGNSNTASGTYSTIIAGVNNTASTDNTTIIGGSNNTIGDGNPVYSIILGGNSNTITGNMASNSAIMGGNNGTINGKDATITGGESNKIEIGTSFSSILGGEGNLIQSGSSIATIVGGHDNIIKGSNSSILSGNGNNVNGNSSNIFGGYHNTVEGYNATALGGWGTIAFDNNSTAIGGGVAKGNYSVAIGRNAITVGGTNTDTKTDINTMAIGYQATANEDGTISFGHKAGDIASYTKGDDGWTSTTYDSDSFNRLVKVADGVEDHDVATVGQVKKLVAKSGGGASYTAGEDIIISDDNEISVSKVGKVASGDTGLVTGDTVYGVTSKLAQNINEQQTAISAANNRINSLSTSMESMRKSISDINNTVSNTIADLSGTMGSFVSKDLTNISDDGRMVLKDLIKAELKNQTAQSGSASSVSTQELSLSLAPVVSKSITDPSTIGQATPALDALTEKVDAKADKTYVDTELAKKADKATVDAISAKVDTNSKNIAANTEAIKVNAKDISDLKENKADKDGSNIDVSSWSEKLGTGKVTKDDAGLVTGGTVFSALEGKADLDYVNSGFAGLSNQMQLMNQNLTKDINNGVAAASALAALKPLDYDSSDKFNFAVGYGHYKNANSTALGAFYYANADTMFNFGATIGNGTPALNAGLSFKLGKGSSYAGVSKADLVKDNIAMHQEIDEQRERIEELEAMVKQLMAK